MVVYITEESVWAGPTLSHVAFACSYILCVKKKNLLDVEESLWAGPTRGLWFFVRGACGRDPPGGEALKKTWASLYKSWCLIKFDQFEHPSFLWTP